MESSREVAVGLFQDSQQANDAIASLRAAGFSERDISLFVPVHEQTDARVDPTDTAANRGARSIVAGAVLGGLGGWLAGIRALPIPVLGPYIAAGATALGAGIGTILGGVAGIGVPTRRADRNGHDRRSGQTLVLVHAGPRVDEAERILRAYGARDVERAMESAML